MCVNVYVLHEVSHMSAKPSNIDLAVVIIFFIPTGILTPEYFCLTNNSSDWLIYLIQ